MKSWKNPEVKVFNVKMNENIADSGEEILDIRHSQSGVLADKWESFKYYVSNGTIVDTSYTYHDSSNLNPYYFTMASPGDVSGCMA